MAGSGRTEKLEVYHLSLDFLGAAAEPHAPQRARRAVFLGNQSEDVTDTRRRSDIVVVVVRNAWPMRNGDVETA